MSAANLAGLLLVISPFVALTVWMAIEEGWSMVWRIWGTFFGLVLLFAIGTALMRAP